MVNPDKGEELQMTNENALHLIRNHIIEGRAVNPLAVISSEFTNRREVAVAGVAIIGMLLTSGIVYAIGKDTSQ